MWWTSICCYQCPSEPPRSAIQNIPKISVRYPSRRSPNDIMIDGMSFPCFLSSLSCSQLHFSYPPLVQSNQKYKSLANEKRIRLAVHKRRSSISPTSFTMTTANNGKIHDSRPVLVSDILDTLVRDPFFNGMASHFNFESMKEFIDAKSPGVWVDFEVGQIDESAMATNFFKDGRHVDLDSLKSFLKRSYQLLPGIDQMLRTLRRANIEVHACSNYPVWADLIEQAVGLNANYGVRWTYVSGVQGIRKPDKRVYTKVAELAGVPISSCIFLDDRDSNCQAATDAGMTAIKFVNAEDCQQQLQSILSKYDVNVDFSQKMRDE